MFINGRLVGYVMVQSHDALADKMRTSCIRQWQNQ